MSGPIVRKYGFPNFESIFGTREVQHGVDDDQPKPPADPDGADLPPDLPHTGEPIDPTDLVRGVEQELEQGLCSV